MMSISLSKAIRICATAGLGLVLSACATAYGDRGGEAESPLKGIAEIGGMATSVPEAKDFVVETRTNALGYIPIGAPSGGPQDRTKPLTPEELLLLQKRLEAAQRQNSSVPAEE